MHKFKKTLMFLAAPLVLSGSLVAIAETAFANNYQDAYSACQQRCRVQVCPDCPVNARCSGQCTSTCSTNCRDNPGSLYW